MQHCLNNDELFYMYISWAQARKIFFVWGGGGAGSPIKSWHANKSGMGQFYICKIKENVLCEKSVGGGGVSPVPLPAIPSVPSPTPCHVPGALESEVLLCRIEPPDLVSYA